MEVARTDAGDVPLAAADMHEFGVHLQPLHTEHHVDARILHLFRPVDVRLLIETGQQFDDDGYLLAVASGANQRLHHLRITGQPIHRHAYGGNVGRDGRFAQYPQERRKTVIGIVQKPVAGAYRIEHAAMRRKFGFQHGFECRITQVTAAAVRETHEVFHVVVTPAGHLRIPFVYVQHLGDAAEHTAGHGRIIDEPDGFALLPALHPLGYLLKHPVAHVAVELHLGILGELEGIGLELRIRQPLEDERQAETHRIVEEHQALSLPVVGQAHETPELLYGQLDKRILIRNLALLRTEPDGEVYRIVGLVVELTETGDEQRIRRTVEPGIVEGTDILALHFVQLRLVQQPDTVLSELLLQTGENLLEPHGVLGIEPRYLPVCIDSGLLLPLDAFVLILDDTVERRHPDTEKLVEVVGIDAEKTEPFQQRYLLFLSLQQDTPVEIHPTDIPLHIIFLHKRTALISTCQTALKVRTAALTWC